jgi:hypothetical protein
MSGITGAAIGGGLVAGVGSVGGALIGKGAAADATAAQIAGQREGADKSAALLKDFYGQSQAQLKPFMDAQLGALKQEQGFTDPNNPIYQQERTQMTNAIQRQLAAQGLLRSKNQTDLLTNMELGLNQQRMGTINSLANIGAVQQGAANTQGLGSSLASIYGGAAQNIGQAQAQGALASGQAIGGMFTGLGNAVQGAYGNYLAGNRWDQQMGLLKGLLPGAGKV